MAQTRKKRIAFISHASHLYGAPRSLLLLLLRGIDSQRYAPILVCPNEGPIVNQSKALGIPTYVIPRGLPNLRRPKKWSRRLAKAIYILRLSWFLRRMKPHLVYVNTIAHTSPVIVGKILRIPTLVHMRESDEYLNHKGIVGKLRLFIILRFPDRFICVSEVTKQLLLEKDVPSQKITVVHNGVDLDEFKPSKNMRQKKRHELGLDDEDILVGLIGQLIPRKGIEEFIEAASVVREKTENCRFVVVGGSVDSPFFRTRIAPLSNALRLKDCMTFTGFKQHVRSYLSAMDIVVNASRKEPFARVNLEAMAMQKPVVATDAGGNAEAIIQGRTGYITPVRDPQSMAERISALAKEGELRKKFGKAGRQRVERHFTIDDYCKGVARVLHQVLRIE